MLRIVTKILLVLNVKGNIMSVFVLIPLMKVVQNMIAKVIKNNKRISLDDGKWKVGDKTEKDDKSFLNAGTAQKPFGNDEIKKELENVDIVINTLNHEKISVNTLLSDICLPINSQEKNFCKQNYKHLSNLNFADNNTKSKTLEIDALIGRDYYWSYVCDETGRSESGPVVLLTKLGYDLSGPIKRKKNQSNKHVNIIHSHAILKHYESKPELIDTNIFWNNEKIGTENLKDDVIKNAVDSFVKKEFNDNEKFENHIFKSFCENVKFVDGNYW